ncbi:MAG: hypothetical protein JST00_40560 [Deltaproteobacteria bacterium]|nr:hypothetical protein [Deltaproteobacteria bacterium]
MLQHVEAVCAVGDSANGLGHFTVGKDVLVETSFDPSPKAKPTREHVFCPKTLPDGGSTKPQLGIWENCRRAMVCKVVADPGDGGADAHAEIECGADRAILEVVGGRTILRGSFGERELAPHPMKIEPVKRERRNAAVDC